jgi:hypothetical protein
VNRSWRLSSQTCSPRATRVGKRSSGKDRKNSWSCFLVAASWTRCCSRSCEKAPGRRSGCGRRSWCRPLQAETPLPTIARLVQADETRSAKSGPPVGVVADLRDAGHVRHVIQPPVPARDTRWRACSRDEASLGAVPVQQLLQLVVDRLELADEVDGEPAAGASGQVTRLHGREQVAGPNSGGWTSRLGWTRERRDPPGHRAAATQAVTVNCGFGDVSLVRHGRGARGDLPCPVSGRVTGAGAGSRADTTRRGGSDVGDEVRALP